MMIGRLRIFGAALWVGIGSVQSAVSVPLIAPAEGPVPFRRDRVPLDQGTILTMSRELVILARATSLASGDGRRGVAQMLALASVLDPANVNPGKLITKLVEEKEPALEPPDEQEAERAKLRLWQLKAWLEAPEAGADGQALAACLADVLVIADPAHPRVAPEMSVQERGAWEGWVASKAAFEEIVAEEPQTVQTPAIEASRGDLGLAEASVQTPLWVKVPETETTTMVLTPVRLAKVSGGNDDQLKPFSLSISCESESPVHAEMTRQLERELTALHGALPAVSLEIVTPGKAPYLFSRNRRSITASAFVIASAAITGREPAGIVIGELGPGGTFIEPSGFWDRLRSLPPSGEGRLVIPMSAADQLAALLALETPEFFLRYEVLGARNLQELLDFSAQTLPQAVVEHCNMYLKIRDQQTGLIGQYLARPPVRQKLEDLGRAAPYHLSVRMMAIQGSGKRPVVLPRGILAAELRRALVPMEWLAKHAGGLLTPELAAKLEPTYDACRTAIDRLERCVDTGDRELFAEARNLSNLIRTLGRSYRLRVDSESGTQAVLAEQTQLVTVRLGFHEKLGVLAADPYPEDDGIKGE